jgi:amino acid adenylation domain-containing protein
VLLLAFHHIVFDGLSLGVFLRELTELYEAFATGRSPSLPPLAVQYADYAAWQRGWLSGPTLDEQIAYWKQQLAGVPELELPIDRPRPLVMSHRGAFRTFHISPSVVDALDAIGHEHSATLFMTLLAAFATLLHRYSGQDDIAIGTPVANRTRVETEQLIGLFVNTLVLRADLSGNPTFEELVDRVRATALGAYAHQDVPFEKLVEELRPKRELSQTPLFQAMFVLQNTPAGPTLADLEQSQFPVETGTSKFDLRLAAERTENGLAANLEYNADVFDAATIERLACHFQNLLAGIVENPAARIAAIQLLSKAERHQLLNGCNDTARDYPQECIHTLFEAQAQRTPDAIAVVYEAARLTYRELDERSNQLAHRLRELGVDRDVLVGLCVERSVEMVVGWLAVLKAGGAYVPLDPAYPKDRLSFMLADAKAHVLIAQSSLAPGLPADLAHVICLDTDWPTIASYPKRGLGRIATPDNLVYVIYTSGSTGRPKGVAIEHRQLANYTMAVRDRIEFPEASRCAVVSTIAADLGNTMVFPALCYGGSLHIISQERATDPKLLGEYFMAEQIDCLKIVPSQLRALLSGADPASVLPRARLVLGGEASTIGFIKELKRLAPECVIHNHYGPTETTVGVLTYRVDDLSLAECQQQLPLGQPLANIRVYVLDQALEPVPTGVLGEIYIGGAGVARGYFGQPELTNERFVPDPYGLPGSRMYRTGDRGRRWPSGAIEFLGRIDHQVKIRGFRVELGEIQTALAQHPSIREVVVIAREDAPGDKRLVAYVVATSVPLDITAVQTYARTRLPDHMIPLFVPIDAIPLTPNGKIDRDALMKIKPAARHAGTEPAPRTRTELELANIFAELLGVAALGPTADFFALGGHSLLAIQLFAAIRARLGAALPLSTLFRAPTVEALARELDTRPALRQLHLVPLRTHGARPPLVLVHPVGGTVFCYHPLVAQLAPDMPCYGLEAVGLDGADPPVETIEELARGYVRTLAGELGRGPIHLAGWSFGGVVALAMERLLVAAGHEVLSTTLIDSFAPAALPSRAFDPVFAIASFAHDLGVAVDESEIGGLGADAALARIVKLAHEAGSIPPHLGVDHLACQFRVYLANLRAHRSYAPEASCGRVVLVRAAETSSRAGDDDANGWRAHLGANLDIRVTAGNHYSMIQSPHVDELARLMDAETVLDGLAEGDRIVVDPRRDS